MLIKLKNETWDACLVIINALLLVLMNVFMVVEGFNIFQYLFAAFIVTSAVLYFFSPKLYRILSLIIGVISAILILIIFLLGLSIELGNTSKNILVILYMIVFCLAVIGLSILMFYKWYGYHFLSAIISIYFTVSLLEQGNKKLALVIIMALLLIIYIITIIQNIYIKGKEKSKFLE